MLNFADMCYVILRDTQVAKLRQLCLQILINLTCLSVRTSLHLSMHYGASTLYETLLDLIKEPNQTNDAVWLLNHLVTDGPANLAKLFRGHLFKILAE